MPRSISFTFPGEPVPAPRPRFAQRGTYMPEPYTAYKEALAWMLKAEMGRRKPMYGAISITLDFYRKNHRRVDLDNLVKTVMDAGNGVGWLDDAQIVELHARKFLGCADPRVEVTLEKVE